jgi:hypothetical protein
MKNGLIINQFGKFYYLNDQFHRVGGPAIEDVNGTKAWYVYGKQHREDGPAIEWNDGDKYWYYHGEKIDCKTQKEFEQFIKLKAFL